MKYRTLLAIAALLLAGAAVFFPGGKETLQLPPPKKAGGMPLMQALNKRETSREFGPRELSPQVLSDLLWAAAGVNRPSSLKRTAPSAKNWQEISVYVAFSTGVYLYDALSNTLEPQVQGDIRMGSSLQSQAREAPALLLFVADYARMTGVSGEVRDFYAAADTGYISENVYLFCASEGLATGVMGGFDRDELAKQLGLDPAQRKVVLVQAVGYPKPGAKKKKTPKPFIPLPGGNISR